MKVFHDESLLFLPLKLFIAEVAYKVNVHKCQLPCIGCPITDIRNLVTFGNNFETKRLSPEILLK